VRRRLAVLAAVAGALWLAPGALAAGWCGSGEQASDRTDIVTGRQIHAVVVVPADGADDFATSASQIADDAASMTAWWVGQDPTREPRFDQATFGATNCLDIAFVRLPQPAAAITGASSLFQAIGVDMQSANLLSPYKKYLVYYDGPSVETNVCGVGGGGFSTGPALAVVIPAGCPGVPTDSVAAHELLHALGAVPPGDPNACPNDPGHPCDSPTDVLYPYTRGEPLSQKVLDYNHDDYYGHSGSWPDIQDSLWLSHLDTPQEPLTIVLSGAGDVTSDVPGVDCTADCTTQWDLASTFTLDAEPAPGQRFVGWRGACTGVGACFVTMASAETTTAVFGPSTVPVKITIAGKGKVTCNPRCSRSVAVGSSLTLVAKPAKGWRFGRWAGACKGTIAICRPSTNAAVSVRATFRRKR
jgi:hypothetical protein